MTSPFNTSQSKVNAWRLCKLKHHRQYVDHLKPKRKSRPLKFGGIVHTLQETIAEGDDPQKKLAQIGQHERKLFEAEREYYGEIITDIGYIIRAYQKFWAKDPLHLIPIKGKRAEHSFEIELTKDITCKGRIDGLVKYRGLRSLLEHKNNKNFPNDDHRWRNLQSAIYIRITDMLGWGKLEGTLWNYVRSKPPTRPQMLKSGELSQKSVDSLPDVVSDVIKENKLNPKAYRDFLHTQEINLQTWFMRVYTPVKTEVVKMLFSDFVATSREMADYYSKTSAEPVRTIGQHCSWCAFEPLCRAELQGSDVDFVLDHEFEIDETEYQTAGELDEAE